MKPDWSGRPAEYCDLCGAPLDGRAVRKPGRTVCGACGSATTDPVPDAAALDAAYGTWYWPGSGSRFGLPGDALLRRSRASMADRIDRIAPAGPVLDVGAGEGTLIDALRSRGREALGLERDSSRDDMIEGDITRVDGHFAAIVFWHSLEHLGDSGRVLDEAADRLLPGGVVVVAVPDLAGLQAQVFGNRWLHLDLPRHLVHLRGQALIDRMSVAGLTTETVSRTRGGQNLIGWLDGLVGSLPGDLNLYQALRRRPARRIEMGPLRRTASIVAGILLAPVAVVCAATELIRGRSGTIYVEGRLV